MNIPRLLDSHINEKHPLKDEEDRLTDKVLALAAELMECANEWRGFKFWSNDRAPRNKCMKCQFTETPHECRNPLLEEFVDCLHFIISIGLDLKILPEDLFIPIFAETTSSEMFLSIQNDVLTLDLRRNESHYHFTFARIMELGLSFGFTTSEIEEAYYSKNKINHARQENNY